MRLFTAIFLLMLGVALVSTGLVGLLVLSDTRELLTRDAQELAAERVGQVTLKATAAIDVSDGLSTDLDHLCRESGVAAEVEAEALPLARGATLHQALHGGEDYELLFTAKPGTKIPSRIAGVPITRIGRIVKKSPGRSRVVLVKDSRREPLEPQGWEHFS